MKVKCISRDQEVQTRERSSDVRKLHKNVDPVLHPLEQPREYVRALNAVKLNRMFAKPFLCAMQGHRDGVYSIARHPTSLTTLVSGAGDGEIRIWNVASQTCASHAVVHSGIVRGLCFSPNGDSVLTCSSDKTVKRWMLSTLQDVGTEDLSSSSRGQQEAAKAKAIFLGQHAFLGVDHVRGKGEVGSFVTCGAAVEVWDYHRSDPISTITWGTATTTSVACNPVETNVFASVGTDRNICLYDTRGQTAIRKVILKMKSNQISWNPMEAFNFTVANEDSKCYTFDIRKLSVARNIHKGHVDAVISLDYSPTGREFATGSYDKTIRIFSERGGQSRDVYHTKRMQRIFQVRYSGDSRFILSGSDDTNVRVWKANASEKLGVIAPREKAKLAYSHQLRERYKHVPEVGRIDRQRHVPKPILNASRLRVEMKESRRRKLRNVRAHSKPGAVPYEAERLHATVEEEE
mmetsp:Transcript_3709/g.10168  ORF Transcript_3709/g.10168 Transcript_3709/m.10168 type:complete len:462 (+) Transcript_3709:135-1520(+)|eukprot:CAMPEP_0119142798 /NCGR_PEP_ID=MMETSP1310-20130426/33307_1 /TAXON_ID=464262 /ORGANISM="Genus nov. species nov., Strain RCC2339" /LENGTH=461 /DNA_ID=CAMNT_0007134371 /DNA_START=118 /DNA_END=1503 /DNA_ORIENTATION=-